MNMMADVIVNRMSGESLQFLDYSPRGDESPYAGLFLTYGAVFPGGATAQNLLALHLPRPRLIPPAKLNALVKCIHANSQGQSRQTTAAAASNLDLCQINCTFYAALGRDDRSYLPARAMQFFLPGVPQVYCVGLLASESDMDLLARSGAGRDIETPPLQPRRSGDRAGQADGALAAGADQAAQQPLCLWQVFPACSTARRTGW